MWFASASTKPRSDFCTTMIVVPTGGNDTPTLLLGCGPAVGPVAWGELLWVGPVVAVWPTVGPGAAAALPAAPVDGAAVAAVVDPRPVLDVEDPPHAVSSSSDPRPAAATHPLLRITFSFIDGPLPARIRRERVALLRSPAGDVAGGQLDHVPQAPHAVTGRRERLRALVGVQGVAVVGDLLGAVRRADGAERAGQGIGRQGLRGDGDRGPGRGARPGAGRRAALLVVPVGVDHLAVGLGEHISEIRLLDDQHGRPRRVQRHAGGLAGGRGGRGRGRTPRSR